MQVAHHEAGFHFQKMQQMTQRFLEKREVLRAAHIADVLADEGFFSPREAEGVLELRACGKDRVFGGGKGAFRQPDGFGHEAAGTAHDEGRSSGSRNVRAGVACRKNNGVVHAHKNIPVMKKKEIGHVAEPFSGFPVAEAEGCSVRVAGGHDQRGKRVLPESSCPFGMEKQVMERR